MEISVEFNLTKAQLERPVTAEGIVIWAIMDKFGPWVVLPHDTVDMESLETVTKSSSLIDGKRVRIRSTTGKSYYLVRQDDLVLTLTAMQFDGPVELLDLIICDSYGGMSPVMLTLTRHSSLKH